jgi:hypothetical protein
VIEPLPRSAFEPPIRPDPRRNRPRRPPAERRSDDGSRERWIRLWPRARAVHPATAVRQPPRIEGPRGGLGGPRAASATFAADRATGRQAEVATSGVAATPLEGGSASGEPAMSPRPARGSVVLRGRARGRRRPAPRAELLTSSCSPASSAPNRIGEFWSYPQSRAFAEPSIDCEADRTFRAMIVGVPREEES